MTTRPLIIGLGNAMRSDDGIGPALIAALMERGLCGADLRLLGGESTGLIDAWKDRTSVIMIDAVRAGEPAGTIHEVVVGEHQLPRWTAATSSHRSGLAEAVELAHVLDGLPRRLVILGVEPECVDFGTELSPAVQAALPDLVERVLSATPFAFRPPRNPARRR